MKKILFFCVLTLALISVFAQGKPQQKSTATKTNKPQSAKTPKKEPAVNEVPLPYNSNDCLFAIDIFPDTTFGPTTAPKGGGRVMEIMADPYNSNLFEYEHNTVWYRLQIPYSGKLIFEITPTNPKDDYDFLLYKYTDHYFCNRVASKKIKPLLSNMSRPDSLNQGKIGASIKGTKSVILKSTEESYTSAIPVTKGDIYYLALDNVNMGKGHKIRYSVYVDFYTPKMQIVDAKDKKSITASVFLVEKNSENRVILNDKNFKGGQLRLVPNFEYAMYVKKDGYFSDFEEFNSNRFLTDTLLDIRMIRIEKGTLFEISDVYFEDGLYKLLPSSDSSLLQYVQRFKNHLEVNFEIKGYVQSYGFDVERDMKLSMERAVSVMQYFVEKGIDPERMSAIGMTKKEVQALSAKILNKNQSFTDKKIEIIIKSVDPTKAMD